MNTAYYSAWIPRSYMHLQRVYAYLKKQDTLDITKINHDFQKNQFTCNINYLGKNVKLLFDADGVFIFETQLKNDEIENSEYLTTFFYTLFKKILSIAMPVIKNQIEQGLMPLQQQLFIQTKQKITLKYGFETKKIGKHTMITNRITNQEKTVTTYFNSTKKLNEKFLIQYFFIKSYEHALIDLTEKMVKLFSKTGEMNKKLEAEHMDVETLKEITTYLADKSKDVSLMHSRIEHMKTNYNRKLELWKHYKPQKLEKTLSEQTAIDERYENAFYDNEYVKHLWSLLGEFMDRSLEILQITTSNQEVVESNKLQALVSAEAAQIIATSLLSIVVAEGINISPKYQAAGTIIIWVILFLIISGFFKIFTSRKKVKTLLSK
ncbi:MAG: hypothetical protein GON13_03620 [Nanoarchaeota archaeon]|nr:hypothetical protein [Nanoarchaeota archaeon]